MLSLHNDGDWFCHHYSGAPLHHQRCHRSIHQSFYAKQRLSNRRLTTTWFLQQNTSLEINDKFSSFPNHWHGIIKKEFKEFNLPEAKNSRKGTRDVQESLCRLNLLGDERPRPLLDQHMERLVALRSACIILMYAIHRSCKRSTFHQIHAIFSHWASQQV